MRGEFLTPEAVGLSPGVAFAGYRIEQLVARGGMGVIYRATESQPRRTVALKVVAPEFAGDAQFRERFLREAQIAASIEHPHVVPVSRVGEQDGLLFIAMRFIGGRDLAALLAAEGRLHPARAAVIVDQIADALDAAHALGLVHRDVKPANVLVERRPRGEHVYLTDFGLTKHLDTGGSLTGTGIAVGTTDYMAPEQFEAQRVDARADVYSLGCVLFEALTARVPFNQGGRAARMYAHLTAQPPSVSALASDVPSSFDEVVTRALSKRPDDRYPSAGDLGNAAVAAAEGRSITRSEHSVASGEAAPPKVRRTHTGHPGRSDVCRDSDLASADQPPSPVVANTILAIPTDADIDEGNRHREPDPEATAESPSDLDPGDTRAVAETSEPGVSTSDVSAAAVGPTDRQRYAHSRAETRMARTRAMDRETVVDLRDRARGAGSVSRQPTMRRSRSWMVAAVLAIAAVGAAISVIVASGRTGKPGLVLAAGTDPTVAVSSTGLVTIADRTTDNSISYVQPGVKPWTRTAKLAAAGSPSIADSGGHIVISARSAADGSIWYTTVGAPRWTQTASKFVFTGSGDPKTTVSSTGRVTVADRGTDDSVWYVQPGVRTWTAPIYFTAKGDPSISSADGHTVMAVRGRDDNTIWYLTPGAPRWLSTGTRPRFTGASDPAVAVDGSGRITIVAVAAHHTVWYVQPGRAPWRQMGGFTAEGDPSIAEAGGHTIVAARARDGSIWYTAPGAARWTPTIGNFVASSNPAIGVSSSGQVTIAALSTNRTLWYVQPGLKAWTSTVSP